MKTITFLFFVSYNLIAQTLNVGLSPSEIKIALLNGLNLSDTLSGRFYTTPEDFAANADTVGDGIHDDTYELQAAIDHWGTLDSAWNVEGGYVILRGKNYRHSAKLTIRNNLTIIGAGSDQGTMISLVDNAGDIGSQIEIGRRGDSSPIKVHLEGFKLSGNKSNQTNVIHGIVTYNYIRHSNFKDLFIIGHSGRNLLMTSDVPLVFGRNNYFYNCAFEQATNIGLEIAHGYNLNFLNCYFGFVAGDSTVGVKFTNQIEYLHLDHCWFLKNTNNRYALHVNSAIRKFTITNNIFQANDSHVSGSAAICLETSSGYVANGNISGNIIEGGLDYGIKLLNSRVYNCIVNDNIIIGYGITPFFTQITLPNVIRGNYASIDTVGNTSFFQEYFGTGAIPANSTQITITHKLYTTPNWVIATPQSNEHIWISDITATTFKVNRASSGSVVNFYWEARKKEEY